MAISIASRAIYRDTRAICQFHLLRRTFASTLRYLRFRFIARFAINGNSARCLVKDTRIVHLCRNHMRSYSNKSFGTRTALPCHESLRNWPYTRQMRHYNCNTIWSIVWLWFNTISYSGLSCNEESCIHFLDKFRDKFVSQCHDRNRRDMQIAEDKHYCEVNIF